MVLQAFCENAYKTNGFLYLSKKILWNMYKTSFFQWFWSFFAKKRLKLIVFFTVQRKDCETYIKPYIRKDCKDLRLRLRFLMALPATLRCRHGYISITSGHRRTGQNVLVSARSFAKGNSPETCDPKPSQTQSNQSPTEIHRKLLQPSASRTKYNPPNSPKAQFWNE